MMHRTLIALFLAACLMVPVTGCSDADGLGTGDPNGVVTESPTDDSTVNDGTTPVTPTDPIDDPIVDPIDDPIEDPVDDPVDDPILPEETTLTIAQVVPNKGLASGGEQVEIIGTKFGYGLKVFFGESESEDVFVLDESRLIAPL